MRSTALESAVGGNESNEVRILKEKGRRIREQQAWRGGH